jgi:quinol-cytochrome oxidoreductase complex cytochrome b subunit
MEKLLNWIDARFPLTALWESQWGKYIAPKNFNFWYYFGSLAAFVLVLQIVTGIFLTTSYKPDATKAFESVEYITRVSWGLAHPLHAFDRRIDVLRRRLPAHVSRAAIRELPQAARAHLTSAA